jgi:hypothetical protein
MKGSLLNYIKEKKREEEKRVPPQIPLELPKPLPDEEEKSEVSQVSKVLIIELA